LKNIRTAGEKSWRAAAWALERRYPERYGLRKAGSYRAEQFENLLQGLALAVLEEIHDAQIQERIQIRLAEWSSKMHRKAEAEQ